MLHKGKKTEKVIVYFGVLPKFNSNSAGDGFAWVLNTTDSQCCIIT